VVWFGNGEVLGRFDGVVVALLRKGEMGMARVDGLPNEGVAAHCRGRG
jgi:hypothetical protein